ncbi:Hypothetical predicted protein [Octopus vulgaris]|uniref:Integrase zinc-binding domain-containing protein n=1 Tax=Octopus vulgaris TaxID=6645 RepID=A0AA36B859_OCTVU|nr:Hypothetical predicted protein [Octopus vulgaris]
MRTIVMIWLDIFMDHSLKDFFLSESTFVLSSKAQFLGPDPVLTRLQLISSQGNDLEIQTLAHQALSNSEAVEVPVCYYNQNGVLMRKWRPPDVSAEDGWKVFHQIIVPQVYREHVISLAHGIPLTGHLEVSKTCDGILAHFFLPRLHQDVSQFCSRKQERHCHMNMTKNYSERSKSVPPKVVAIASPIDHDSDKLREECEHLKFEDLAEKA